MPRDSLHAGHGGGIARREWVRISAIMAMSALTSCTNSGTSGSAIQQQVSGWNAALALQTPGPSTTFGNFGKAITTDGADYVDVVWLQGGSTHNDGSIIYLGTGSLMFAQSADQGSTWASSALTAVAPNTGLPKIASANSDIYVVWPAQNMATSNLQIFLLHGGRSGGRVQWSAPIVISDTPVGSNATFPVVAAYDNEIHVAWSDNRNAGVTEVYYTSSLDGGDTWSTPIAISPVDGFNSWTPSVAVNADHVYIAWTDARFGSEDCATNNADCHEVLYFRGSADSGQTWGAETELTCDSSLYTYAPSVFVEDDTIHIAYFQGIPYPPGTMQLYYLRGTNDGQGLSTCSGTQGTHPAIDVQYPTGDNVLSAWRPNISVHNGVVHMVWWGELTNKYSTGQAKVYYTESSDGVNWAMAASLTPQGDGSTYRSFSPNISLSSDGSMVYTLWEDHRNDADAGDPDYQVYFRSGSL
jgi:hypothetical protein